CPQSRSVAGVRRLLGGFIRVVHPDLSPDFPAEAKRINQRSLAELNAYIDALESGGRRPFEEGPEVSRELPFFRALQTRLGRTVPHHVVPLHLEVPSLPAAASELDKEFAAAHLIRGAEVALQTPSSQFSDRPAVAPLFTQKGAGRAAFDKLWWQQTQEELVREAIHGPNDREVRLHVAKRVFACKYGHQLMRKYWRIKDKQKRKRRIANVDALVEAKVQERFPKPATPAELRMQADDEEAKNPVRVLQGGFHPDLVFVDPDLSAEHRREAIRRVCGMNLASDADFWLLENLWKAMRDKPPPVPLVIAESNYKAVHIASGELDAAGDSALHLAVLGGHLVFTRELLAASCEVHARDGRGRSPLHVAAMEGSPELALELLAAGADANGLDDWNQTALHWASMAHSADLVSVLLDGGADPLLQDSFGRTAAFMAAEQGKMELLARLLDKEPSCATIPNNEYWSPLHVAAFGLQSVKNFTKPLKFLETVKLLLAAKAEVDAKDENCRTALHRAAQAGNGEPLQALLAAGASVCSADECRWTPMHYASQEGHLQIAKLLLDAKADAEPKNPTCLTPLAIATEGNQVKMVEFLLKHGADPHARAKGLHSPLMMARSDPKKYADILALLELGFINH
ncbi:Ank2, partial [Symbiodinium microadriaticum]